MGFLATPFLAGPGPRSVPFRRQLWCLQNHYKARRGSPSIQWEPSERGVTLCAISSLTPFNTNSIMSQQYNDIIPAWQSITIWPNNTMRSVSWWPKTMYSGRCKLMPFLIGIGLHWPFAWLWVVKHQYIQHDKHQYDLIYNEVSHCWWPEDYHGQNKINKTI